MHRNASPDPEPEPVSVPFPRALRAAWSARPRPENAAADPARLLTPEQIAAQVRLQPIGVFLADICRDLGIMPSHPLWGELQRAISEYRGNLARLYTDILDRPWLDPVTHQPSAPSAPSRPPFRPTPALPGTGPP